MGASKSSPAKLAVDDYGPIRKQPGMIHGTPGEDVVAWNTEAWEAWQKARQAELVARHAAKQAASFRKAAAGANAAAQDDLRQLQSVAADSVASAHELRPLVDFCKGLGRYFHKFPDKIEDPVLAQQGNFCSALREYTHVAVETGSLQATNALLLGRRLTPLGVPPQLGMPGQGADAAPPGTPQPGRRGPAIARPSFPEGGPMPMPQLPVWRPRGPEMGAQLPQGGMAATEDRVKAAAQRIEAQRDREAAAQVAQEIATASKNAAAGKKKLAPGGKAAAPKAKGFLGRVGGGKKLATRFF